MNIIVLVDIFSLNRLELIIKNEYNNYKIDLSDFLFEEIGFDNENNYVIFDNDELKEYIFYFENKELYYTFIKKISSVLEIYNLK